MLGGHLHRRGWKQDRAQKPTVRGLDQAGFSLLGRITHNKEGRHTTKQQEEQEGHGAPVSLKRQQDSEAHRGTGGKILQWFQPSFARRSWAFFLFDAYD